jgi:hypothetical protein
LTQSGVFDQAARATKTVISRVSTVSTTVHGGCVVGRHDAMMTLFIVVVVVVVVVREIVRRTYW